MNQSWFEYLLMNKLIGLKKGYSTRYNLRKMNLSVLYIWNEIIYGSNNRKEKKREERGKEKIQAQIDLCISKLWDFTVLLYIVNRLKDKNLIDKRKRRRSIWN